MLKKRIGIYFICFTLVFSYMLGGAFAEKNQSHAIPGADWLLGKVRDCTLNVVNGLYLEVLNQAADQTDNQTTKDIMRILTDADNLILAGSLDKSSEKILKELDEIKVQMKNMGKSITNQLNQLYTYETRTDVQNIHSDMNAIKDDYVKLQTRYEDYIQAGNAYAQAILDESSGKIGEEEVTAAKAQLDSKKGQLKKAFIGTEDKPLDFEAQAKKGLKDLAQLTCMYYPGYSSDPKKGRSKNIEASGTYMGHVWTYYENQRPFDHQKYEVMTAAVNESADCFTTLLWAARIYYDFFVAEYEDNPEKKNDLKDINNWYEELSNSVINCLNDLGEQCKGNNASDDYKEQIDRSTDITTLMRPYDVNTSKKIQYTQKDTHQIGSKNVGWGIMGNIKYTSSAVDTSEYMDFYRVAIDGKPYLLLKAPGISGKGAVHVEEQNNVHYVEGQDYYNLLYTLDQCYKVPATSLEAAKITESEVYKGNGLIDYLKNYGGLEKIPDADYVVTTDNRGFTLPKGSAHTEMVYWCSTEIDNNSPEDAREEVDLVDVYKYNEKPLVIMMADGNKKEASSVSVKISDAERGSLSVMDAEGKAIEGKVEAGAPLTLQVKVNKGYELRSLRLIPSYGHEEIIATDDSVDLMQQQGKGGIYTFTYPMPYDNCTFRADFQNEAEGEGTEDNPYKISSAQQLKDYMGKAKENSKYNAVSYQLTKDIDFDKEKVNQEDLAFGGTKEGFTGTFDGGGYTIRRADSSTTNLFNTIGKTGVVKNIRCSVDTGSWYTYGPNTGILAGYNEGLITGCGIEGNGKVLQTVNYTTGAIYSMLVCHNVGTIENCYNNLSMRTTQNHAICCAIAGDGYGEVRNCYNRGDLSSLHEDSSYGICPKGKVFNYYNTGQIKGSLADTDLDTTVFSQTGTVTKGNKGVQLAEYQMKSDEFLKRLNANALKYEGLNQWVFKEGKNDGYPMFGLIPQWHAVSTDIKGKGTLALKDESGAAVKRAPATAKIQVKAVPDSGKVVDNIKLYDAKGKTLQKFDLKPEEDGSVQVSFEMPDQKVTVHAKFAKAQKDAAENGNGEKSAETVSQAAFDAAKLVDQASGITVTGDQINTKAILKVTAYEETDPAHVEIQNAASDDVLSAYDVSLALVDDKGKELKTDEEKFKGSVEVAFPISKEDREKELKVIHDTEKGLKFEGGEMKEDGFYHVKVSHLSPFAVVEYLEDQEANLSAGENLNTDDESGNWFWIVLVCAAAAVIAAAVLIVRKKRS